MNHTRGKQHIMKDCTILKYKKVLEKPTHFMFTIFKCHLTYKILSLFMKEYSSMEMNFIPLLRNHEEQSLPFSELLRFYSLLFL